MPIISALGLACIQFTTAQAANIAPVGTGIIGVNDAIDADVGIPRANSGTTANINDDDIGTHVDTWFNTDPAGVGQGVSYVGVLWPTTRYDNITQLTLYIALFADGGWFGPNGTGPGADGFLAPDYLTEPTVQVTTDHGTNWTSVASSSDYLSAMNFMPLPGEINGAPPLQAVATFTLDTPSSLINGIRIIGQNGGDGVDVNGFLGVFELAVESAPSIDTDLDGLPDSWETANGLNVGTNDSASDPDSDSLNNLDEYNASTNPKQADTDGDGLNDANEVTISLTNPILPDTDGDGLTDGQEVNTTFSDPSSVDSDFDGLSDGDEVNLHNTSPILPDTDNDGYFDAVEVAQGSDPNDPTSLPNNLSLTGHGLLGVKEAVDSGAEVERYHVGVPESIIDGSTATRVDTWNGDDASSLPYTASFVGVIWDAPITDAVASLKLTLVTFLDGGWFGPNGVGPTPGAALTADYLVEPRVEVTVDGFTWTQVDATSDYVTALTGHKIAAQGGLPTLVTAVFTLDHPTNGIVGIRLVGTEGGAASGGFIGVAEFSALSSSTDVDNDEMDDTWERQNGLVVGTNDASGDPDTDGLTNIQEFDANTNPKVADTDGDGLNDGAEINTHNTDPARADSDADGLTDGAEINTHHSNPLALDSDGDGFSDGLEVAQETDPSNASSKPENIAPLGTPIIGIRDAVDSGVDTFHANAGAPAAINDFDLTTHVDTWNGDGTTSTASYVGILWTNPVASVQKLEFTIATFFDGGWFGFNGVGPGALGTLNASEYLVEPVIQVSTDHGTNWQTVAHTSDYLTALDGHALPAAFAAPTLATATFVLDEPALNVNGVRLIGTEGGTASGGFLGVAELKVMAGTNTPPTGLEISDAAIVADHFQFQISTTSGVTHEVQYKDSLGDASWQTLTTIVGDGTAKTVVDTNSVVTHRFYRIAN